jgi:ADP-ribose pyrophosphatase YjhB (NUDIX family)
VDIAEVKAGKRWLPERLWRQVLETMPIPCVDVIFQRRDGAVLYGWRLIRPYVNVWALLGGRMLRGENLNRCASRIAREYGLRFRELYVNGVFPVNFKDRCDVVICLAARGLSGEPRVDNFEFSKFTWRHRAPAKLGFNYRRMVTNWDRASKSKDYLSLSRLR